MKNPSHDSHKVIQCTARDARRLFETWASLINGAKDTDTVTLGFKLNGSVMVTSGRVTLPDGYSVEFTDTYVMD